jgi:hypothetical protein
MMALLFLVLGEIALIILRLDLASVLMSSARENSAFSKFHAKNHPP